MYKSKENSNKNVNLYTVADILGHYSKKKKLNVSIVRKFSIGKTFLIVDKKKMRKKKTTTRNTKTHVFHFSGIQLSSQRKENLKYDSSHVKIFANFSISLTPNTF